MHSDAEKLQMIRESRTKLMCDIEELKMQLRKVNEEMVTYGFINDGRVIEPKKFHLDIAKNKFQKKPKDGIQYLIDNKLMVEEPEAVAKFLKEPDLDKKSIGHYLGDISADFNLKVLTAFVESYDFTNQDFIESLRTFLGDFNLPGESQKIDKILGVWSNHYYANNADQFNHEDEVYILAFATMMLNTTLNNATAMRQNIEFGKEEVFVKDMLEYKDTNFREELIRSVYNAIKTNPLTNVLQPIDFEVWRNSVLKSKLWYMSTTMRNWHQRTFILMPDNLLILNERDKEIRLKISLQNTKIERDFNSNRDFVLNLLPQNSDVIVATKTLHNNSEEQSNKRNFRFACNSLEEQTQWKNEIEKCIDKILETEDINF